MSVKVRTKGAEKAGWQRSLASRTPKSIILGAVAWLNFSANATAPCVCKKELRLHGNPQPHEGNIMYRAQKSMNLWKPAAA
jgi:hypothetical protein